MVKGYVPAKGDIVWLDFNPQSGHEQKGHRPAIVVSGEEYNRKTGLALMCPVTSRVKGYVFEVPINHDGINGVVLSDQVKSLDWKVRNASFIAKADEKELEAVLRNISVILLGD